MSFRPRIYMSGFVRTVVALLAAGAASADERILSYDETVTVNADGSMYVRDVIRVRAEGDKIRRGIYRDFPTIYRGKDGQQYVVAFAFQGASRDGQPQQWHAENRDNGVRIYVGSASERVQPGEHTYELVFRTDRQLGYFADHDELYWNVTGNGWEFPIDRVTARVELPQAVPAAQITLEAYTGTQGAKGQDFTAQMQSSGPLFSTTRGLAAREGLTIVVMWPKGFIMPPIESAQPAPGPATNYLQGDDRSSWSPAERMLDRDLPGSGLPALVGLLGLALLVAYYYWIWARVGRDPPGRIIIPEYESPKGISPAAMGYLLHMGEDDNTFAAAVLSLAVKGHLRIEQTAGVLGLGKKFTLVRTATGSGKALSGDEHELLSALFKGSDRLELEQENHARVGEAQSHHGDQLSKAYSSGFFRINGGWHLLGIVLSLLLAAPAILLPGRTENWPAWHFTTPGGWFTLVCILGMLVANGVFGKLLKAPTVAGQALMDHIRGFRMYLEVAEGEELKRMKGPPPALTPQLFESYLPAALALGVEQRWAERFADVLRIHAPDYTPAWYVGPGWNAADIGGFSREVGSSLSGAIASAATAPGSSSGGGGSGSSGGGGGGGGGGGW